MKQRRESHLMRDAHAAACSKPLRDDATPRAIRLWPRRSVLHWPRWMNLRFGILIIHIKSAFACDRRDRRDTRPASVTSVTSVTGLPVVFHIRALLNVRV